MLDYRETKNVLHDKDTTKMQTNVTDLEKLFANFKVLICSPHRVNISTKQ